MINITETDYSDGAYAGGTPEVPGAPTYVSNEQFRISSSNDIMVLTSDQGGPVSIDIDDGFYSPDDLATELQTKMNANNTLTGTGTITFAVAYNSSTFKFSIDAGTGHTIAYTNSGSDAGATFGFTANASAAKIIYSDTPTEATDTITFDLDTSDNASDVLYAIYDNTQASYIDSTGAPGSETWQTKANWSGGGQAGRVTVYGLTQYTAYTYKVKAKNILEDATAFGSNSDDMFCNVLVDWGTASDVKDRECTTGNTKFELNGVTVDNVTYTLYTAGGYGGIAITFSLINNYSTPSSVKIEFSEDGSTYSAGHHYFTIDSSHDVMKFTSDQGGPVNIDVADGDYNTGALLATELQTKMNANNTLTGTGTITFTVSFSTTTGKYTIDAGTGHTIALDYWNSDAGYSFGFNKSHTATQTITSDESRGSNPRTLATTPTGVEHTIYWDSYTDSGRSEKDTEIYVRLTPYDAVALGGNAGEAKITDSFSVDNTPEQTTLINSDTFEFDADTTPAWEAVMTPMRGGIIAFFRLIIRDYDSILVDTFDSSVDLSGWEYQQDGVNYVACPITGVSGEYIDGTNKVRFTLPATDALTQDNERPYKITLEEGEIRHRG